MIKRFVLFCLVGSVAVIGTHKLFARPESGWHEGSFWTGFTAAGIAGFLAFRLGHWLEEMGAADHPQIIELQTKETPNQVAARAFAASVLFTLIACGLVSLLIWLLWPEALTLLLRLL